MELESSRSLMEQHRADDIDEVPGSNIGRPGRRVLEGGNPFGVEYDNIE